MAQVHKIAVVDTDKIFRQPRFDVCQFPVESFLSLSRHGRYLFPVAFEIVDLLQRKLDEQELAAGETRIWGLSSRILCCWMD